MNVSDSPFCPFQLEAAVASREEPKINETLDKASRMNLYSDAVSSSEAMKLKVADTRVVLRDAIRKVDEAALTEAIAACDAFGYKHEEYPRAVGLKEAIIALHAEVPCFLGTIVPASVMWLAVAALQCRKPLF